MAILFYIIIVLLTAASVMFGLDLVTSPLPPMPNAPIGRTADLSRAKVQHSLNNSVERSADINGPSSDHPTSAMRKAQTPRPAGGPDNISSQALSEPPAGRKNEQTAITRLPEQTAATVQPDKLHEEQAAASPPSGNEAPSPTTMAAIKQSDAAHDRAHCDVQACTAAYRSFRATDCSYQPGEGPRRLCMRSGEAITGIAAPPRQPRTAGAAEHPEIARSAPDRHEIDEITRIVRKMTRGEQGDFPVQDSQGRIIIVHPDRTGTHGPW